MSEPQPPRPPEFKPGQATPPPYEPAPEYPPTSPFPPVNYAPPGQAPDYGQQGYPPPGHAPDHSQQGYPPPGYPDQPGYGPPPPRRSNKPMIAVVLAVAVLLCGGVITSGVLLVQRATEKVEEVAAPILEPTLPALPTDLPTALPELPGFPTDLPGLPTDLPAIPGLGEGAEITVTYEVDGDGPVNIVYTEKLGETPKVLQNVDLPWRVSVDMRSPTVVSVTAQRTGTGDGSVTCRAAIDDKAATEQTTEGPLATASCFKMAFE